MVDRERASWRVRLVILVLALAPVPVLSAMATKPAIPGVEVKFFLDPRVVLDANRLPIRDVLTTFSVADAPRRIQMEFLDGRALQLHGAGWNVRLRRVEGKGHLEVDFKRGYPVEAGLNATLAQAARDGFDADEKDYDAELEWSFEKETLTFTNPRKFGGFTGGTFSLPSPSTARALAVQAIPGKLKRFNEEGWAEGVLSSAQVYGPVEGRRWRGRHSASPVRLGETHERQHFPLGLVHQNASIVSARLRLARAPRSFERLDELLVASRRRVVEGFVLFRMLRENQRGLRAGAPAPSFARRSSGTSGPSPAGGSLPGVGFPFEPFIVDLLGYRSS
jgi:hypothetical protein